MSGLKSQWITEGTSIALWIRSYGLTSSWTLRTAKDSFSSRRRPRSPRTATCSARTTSRVSLKVCPRSRLDGEKRLDLARDPREGSGVGGGFEGTNGGVPDCYFPFLATTKNWLQRMEDEIVLLLECKPVFERCTIAISLLNLKHR